MKTSCFSINGIVEAWSHKRLLSKGKPLAVMLPMVLTLAVPGYASECVLEVKTLTGCSGTR